MKRGMLTRLGRLLRHRWRDESASQRCLGREGLARLTARVGESETLHTGQIRVCIEAGLPLSYLWRDASPRERALTLFGKLRVWDTEQNNGVLIYLLLADHAIEVVADRGVARAVAPATWQALVQQLRPALAEGRFEAGLLAAVAEVEAWLVRHYPRAPGDAARNELPDTPDLR